MRCCIPGFLHNVGLGSRLLEALHPGVALAWPKPPSTSVMLAVQWHCREVFGIQKVLFG
jgi:hypothetical protein